MSILFCPTWKSGAARAYTDSDKMRAGLRGYKGSPEMINEMRQLDPVNPGQKERESVK